MPNDGVLIMGFGGPDSLEAVGPFMCNLMGREPSDALVERVCARYEAIGGSSPLPQIAKDIALALESELIGRGHDVPVRVGMRYWHPYISEGVEALRGRGVERVFTVSLSPFESKVATGAYREAVSVECDCMVVDEVVSLHTIDAFAAAHAGALRRALDDAPAGALVVFSAHSLPLDDLETDDEYVAGLRSVADAVAAEMGWAPGSEDGARFGDLAAYGTREGAQHWLVAYQSKGAKPGDWLGPDLDEIIEAASAEDIVAVVCSPIGFLTDHMETLYDLDYVAAEQARGVGVTFARAEVPNAEPAIISAIADEIEKQL